jgi:hypothetical protein
MAFLRKLLLEMPHVDAARDVGANGAVERGPELLDSLDPEALAADACTTCS